MSVIAIDIAPSLRCPGCLAPVQALPNEYLCNQCQTVYPVVAGIPIFIHEARSAFTIQECANDLAAAASSPPAPRRWRDRLPSISGNYGSEANFEEVAQLLLAASPRPRVLVLGGRILGTGMEAFVKHTQIELVETDVCPGPRVKMICDAHDVPFADATFDGVIIQAVLEHVCDPWRCVAEIHRVLKPRGLVYAETPFIQQVHGGAWDFTRFTDLGHRRLFRHFEQVRRGACCGPGMALAWTFQYFLLSLTESKRLRGCIRIGTELTTFWLKHVDRFLMHTRGTQDAASGFYFIGRRSDTTLSDRDLIKEWRGII